MMRSVLAFAFAAALSTGALAQTDQEHAGHHPEGASAPAAKATPEPAPKVAAVTPTKMDMQMRSMQEMHETMMAAKTPEERQALMAEHMKFMHGGKTMSPEVPGKRMDMVNREVAPPPAGK